MIGIVAFIVAVGVGTGIVLHKQGKLPSTASVSEIFKGAGESIPVEPGEIKSKIEQVSEPLDEVITPEASKSSDEEIQQKTAEPEDTQQLAEGIETQEEFQLETEFKVGPELEPQSQSEPKSQEEKLELDLCAGIICPACQYCLNGKCIAGPDGYNDCGSGCQRCVNGSCRDYDSACSNCQYCSSDACVNYCQGTDNSCGCTTCVNCNDLDGCSGDNYLDYYCSGTSCVFNSDDCSDCSCSCGGYNVEESIANGNCEDGKDNDCDGNVDSQDPDCTNKDKNCHTGSLWSQGYCTPDCKCKAGEGDCNSGADCETGYCAQDVGERYGQAKWVDICEEIPYLKILSPTEAEEWEKGKTYTIKWGFRGAENLKSSIVLVGAPFGLSTIASDVPLVLGEYRWTISPKLGAGKFYKIRMYLNGSHDSDYFKIVGKNIPDIQTLPVLERNITSAWAGVEGEVISLNAASNCTKWFEWGETPSLGQETPHHGGGQKYFGAGIYPLSPNTTYYFRAVMGCDDGIGYGEIKSFTTKPSSVTSTPIVATLPARHITTNQASLCAQIGVEGENYRDEFELWFEWGETPSLGNKTDPPSFFIFLKPGDPGYSYSYHRTPKIIEDPLSGLSPNTTYYFRVVAKNNIGTTYGEIKSFTTAGE